MAVITSAGTGNSNAGATWSSDPSVPDLTSDVVIQSGHTITLNTTHTWNSLTLLSGGTLDGDNNELTIDGEPDGTGATYAGNGIVIDGAISGTDTDITLTFNGATAIDLAATSGGLRNFTINHADCVATAQSIITLTGDLTITAGTLDTHSSSNRALTVAGKTTVGNAGASPPANTSVLICNASACSFGSGITANYGLQIQTGGTFTGGSGAHTMGSFCMDNNHADCRATLSSGVTTINSEKNSTDKAIEIAGSNCVFAHGSGTVIITFAGASAIREASSTLALNNLTINHSSANINLKSALTVAGILYVQLGELDTDSDDYALTVTGKTSIAGTLVCNDSTCSFGSGTTGDWGLRVNDNGTFTGGGGTHTMGSLSVYNASDSVCTLTDQTTTIDSENSNHCMETGESAVVTHSSGKVIITTPATTILECRNDSLNDLTINHSSAVIGIYDPGGGGTGASGQALRVVGDLVIAEGKLTTTAEGRTDYGLVVDGHTIIESGGTLTGGTANVKLGSLTILSGGTYSATSGTTTIRDEWVTDEVTGGINGYCFHNAGTFTHNYGLVLFDFAAHTSVKSEKFYDVELNMNASTWEVYFVKESSAVDILGDFTITQGTFDTAPGDTYTIHGNTYLAANGVFIVAADHDTNKIIHHGLVTNLGTYKINDGTTVKMNGGIRQLNTLTIA